MYTQENKTELIRLFKVTNASDHDIDSINNLYKLYVNPNARYASKGCNNCNHSIVAYYEQLRDWYVANINKFE